MILRVHDKNTNKRYVWPIKFISDFDEIMQIIPSTANVVYRANSLKEAAENVAAYLGAYYMDAWVDYQDPFAFQKDPFAKSAKQLAIAAGLAACLTLPLAKMSDDAKIFQAKEEQEALTFRPFGHKKEDTFLMAIMQLESSGGKNTNHPQANCIGRFGLMKNTIKDLVRNDTFKHADIKLLLSLESSELRKMFEKKPHIEVYVARLLAKQVLKKNNDNMAKAAYAWRYGHNLSPAAMGEELLANDTYVRKFRHVYGEALTKSETAVFETRFNQWLKKRREKDADKDLLTPSEPGLPAFKETEMVSTSVSLSALQERVNEAKKGIMR